MNEYELLYLFQEGHNQTALFSLYKLYVLQIEGKNNATGQTNPIDVVIKNS